MKKSVLIYALLTAFCLVFIGCSTSHFPSDYAGDAFAESGAPRMVIRGKVTDAANRALPGIYVSVPGMREPGERDALSYNYALTDSAGQYLIIRYRGRELHSEVTVVATDSTGCYLEQYLFAPVTYDSVPLYRYGRPTDERTPYNAFVEADFILSLQN